MKTYRLLRATLALTLAFSAAACAKQTKSADDAAPADGATLTFYSGLSQAEWTVLKEDVFPPFDKANHCHVEGIDVNSGDVARKLDALRQGGHMNVDVIAQDNMTLAELVQAKLMDDLTPYASTIPKATIPALLPVGRFNGHDYFFPYRPNVEIAYYNENYLNKYGLKPPTNWDELYQTAKFLYDKEGVGRVAIKAAGGADTTCHLFDFINQAGGDPMTLNDAGCVKAFTYLKKLWPYLSPESRRADYNTMNQFLAMDSVYIGQNWPFGIQVVVHDGEKTEIKAYHGWSGPVREAHTLGGDVLGIPVGAPHKDLALKFIQYMESQPVQSILVSKLAWPSMRTDAYGQVPAWQQPYFAAVKEALAHSIARPNVPYWEDFDKDINLAFTEITLDDRGVQETLDKYAALLAQAKAAKSKM